MRGVPACERLQDSNRHVRAVSEASRMVRSCSATSATISFELSGSERRAQSVTEQVAVVFLACLGVCSGKFAQ